MTKKQLAALDRILERERNSRQGKPCGVHPAHDRYIITDGSAAVILFEKPDGVPEADNLDSVFSVIQNDWEECDYTLALTVTAERIKDWKRLARPWRAGKTQKDGVVPVRITAWMEGRAQAAGSYNPALLVDAVEAVGPGCMVYIGYSRKRSSQRPNLIVYPKDWMERTPEIMGYVLPLRI